MVTAIYKLYIILWRNISNHLFNWCTTIWFISIPVLIFCSLAGVRSTYPIETYPDKFYKPFETRIPVLTNTSLKFIAWSPLNPVLEKIMANVTNAIAKDENIQLYNQGFEDSKILGMYLSNEINLLTTLAGVVFDDSLQNISTLPPIINVTLRFPGELRNFSSSSQIKTWTTNYQFPVFQVAGPRDWNMNEGAEPSYYSQGFLKLQQEVSYEIINYFKVKNGSKPADKVRVVMQRYPYPKWKRDDFPSIIRNFAGIFLTTLIFAGLAAKTISDIVTEKQTQQKEMVKIMGLPSWLLWLAWFLSAFLYFAIIISLITMCTTFKFNPNSGAFLEHSDPSVFFVFLISYACAVITFSFIISCIFVKATIAMVTVSLGQMMMLLPYYHTYQRYAYLSFSEKMFHCFFADSALAYGCQLIFTYESFGEGSHWNNIWKSPSPEDNFTLGHVMIMLLIDSAVYFLIALYIEQIFPGPYGIPRTWCFLFTKSFWWCKPRCVLEDYEEMKLEGESYEKEPADLQRGIQIINLQKEFPEHKIAVQNLNLNIYKDQITVLLGHNGAGKTTAISMLTGMIAPSSGTAIVNGYDIRRNIDKVRSNLGYCPQQNILFETMSAKNHLFYYCALKGVPIRQIRSEVDRYLHLFDLKAKEKTLALRLSGGMKRKLSVAIALCGDSDVVMLDEPTTGMDPDARRSLWTLLESQKKGRIILLTTHSMDEADVLGDRIAILAHGQLQCCGSSFFLKKKYCAGSHLIMEIAPSCDTDRITTFLQSYISNIKIESKTSSELRYILSEDYKPIFQKLFQDLESKRTHLNIINYGVSLTTLEEVFMKVGVDRSSMVENSQHRHDSSDILVRIQDFKSAGCSLMWNQFRAMLRKQIHYDLRTWYTSLLKGILPVLALLLPLMRRLGNPSETLDLPKLKIQLASYANPITAITYNGTSNYVKHYIGLVSQNDLSVLDWKSGDISKLIFKEIQENTEKFRQCYVVGASFTKDRLITAWFNNEPYHSPPLSLQLAMNAILKTEASGQHYIQFYNYPLPFSGDFKFRTSTASNSAGNTQLLMMTTAIILTFPLVLSFYVNERANKAKLLQFVSGVNFFVFWGAAFLFDILNHAFTCMFIVIAIAAIKIEEIYKLEEIGAVFLLIFCIGLSALPCTYVCSTFTSNVGRGYLLMQLYFLVPLLTYFFAEASFSDRTRQTIRDAFLVSPFFAMYDGLMEVRVTYIINKICNGMLRRCIDYEIVKLTEKECQRQVCLSLSQCCKPHTDYYSWKEPGIGKNIVFLLITGLFFWLVLYTVECGLCKRITIRKYPTPAPPSYEDDDVLAERRKLETVSPQDRKKYTVFMKNLTKYYRQFLAVNSLYLGIKRTECFGLLGVNGAGKTTTFKMVTGEIRPTRGNVWLNGLNMKSNPQQVFCLMGYCPQDNALIEELTCRETIVIFSLLRGISNYDSHLLAEELGIKLNFQEHLDKQIRKLSGGTRRKVSTAVALTGDASLLCLDEPTAGLDPAARRHVWNLLSTSRERGKCIVLTSHDMEECEALCTRLAIMVNGSFKCLGTVQHLKSKFSDGYTLIIKGSEGFDTEAVKKYIQRNFEYTYVRNVYGNTINFCVVDRGVTWAKLYSAIEKSRESLHIEDYTVGQNTLEQVFLSFTKQQRTGDQ